MTKSTFLNWVLIFIASIILGYLLKDRVALDFSQDMQHYAAQSPNAVQIGKTLGVALAVFILTLLGYGLMRLFYRKGNKQKSLAIPVLMAWVAWGIMAFLMIFSLGQ